MKKSILLASASLVLFSFPLSAQQFQPDPAFGTNGRVTTDFSGYDDAINAIAIQPDGKIVAAGLASNGNNFDFALCRYHANGQPDSSFGTYGKVVTPLIDNTNRAHMLAIQPDGKIVAAGFVYNPAGWDFGIARYLPDGSLDPDFGNNGVQITDIDGTDDFAYAMALQPDGKIVLGGYAEHDLDADFALVRYTADGDLDAGFGTTGKVKTGFPLNNDRLSALAIRPDGKIVATGWSNAYSTASSPNTFAVAQFLPDGTRDSLFGTNGVTITPFGSLFNLAYAVVLQPDGKIVVGGSSNNGSYNRSACARYHENGSLDTGFGDGGIFMAPFDKGNELSSLSLRPDGTFIAGGTYGQYPAGDFALMRLSADGSLDTDFGTNGLLKTDFSSQDDHLYSLAFQPDGKIVAAGFSSSDVHSDFALVGYREQTGSTGTLQQSVFKNTASIAPNPVGQQAILNYELEESTVLSIQLVNSEGRVVHVFSENEKTPKGPHQQALNFPAELPAGIYRLLLSAAGERAVLTIFK